ncbi:MAG: LPS-assembly protein LptD, partial [Acidobacteriaceae bacterium]|nr:LPS-assembly protein LptD [Acidobacteriaceae bacterium]
MRTCVFVFITLLALSHPQVGAQTLTKQFPQSDLAESTVAQQPEIFSDVPVAQPEPEKPEGVEVTIRARTQSKRGGVYTLHGDVEIDYKTYAIRADDIRYDTASGEMTAEGHLQVDGGPRDEHISATNGTLNVDRQTGRFYNVTGAIGGRPLKRNVAFAATNPFLFTGRVVEKDGPDRYVIHDGSMTSCSLPRPDWLLTAKQVEVNGTKASAKNVTFRLVDVPLFFLPYATHGTDVQERRTGFLIPTAGTSSTKGTILGEAIYIVLGRSADLTLAAEYYSLRGFAQSAEFRYRGRGLDGMRVRYTGLLDRGLVRELPQGPVRIDQGGEDVVVNARRDFSEHTRAVADAEYLSSYQYRQAFTENFFLAVQSEVKSVAFITHERDGIATGARFDRYQNFLSVNEGQEIRLLHLPSLDADVAEHSLARSRLYYGVEGSGAGLSRAEPGFVSASPIARLDLHPYISIPLVFGGATLRPSLGLRETYYSARELSNSGVPVQLARYINRNALEAGLEMRTPTLERVFDGQWKHTVSGYAQYRFVSGVENFQQTLRYDLIDLLSDTNEMEYGVTQRLFRRSSGGRACRPDEIPDVPGATECHDGQAAEWLSWRVAQKYFFDPTFGGAVVPGVRN